MKVDKATLVHPRFADARLSMLQHAIDRLGKLVSDVAVSAQSPDWPATWQPPKVAVIADEQPDLGPAMAVYSCLQYASASGFNAILVTPIDMPDLQVEHLQRLKSEWLEQAKAIAIPARLPVVATFDSVFPQPLIGIYPTCLLHELEELTRSSRRSLSGWLMQRDVRFVQLPQAAGRNWNSPQD